MSVRWASGASLRSFIDPLPEEMRSSFIEANAEDRPFCPAGPDGLTLLPLRRVFVITKR